MSEPIDLLEHGRRLLSTASESTAGRAARNLLPGADQVLTQTLLALAADAVLADHTAPGPATLQVLDGSGILTADGGERRVEAGQWVRIPDGPHGLRAVTDLVCLLTVAAPHRRPRDPDTAT